MQRSSSSPRVRGFLRYPRFTQLPLGAEIALVLLVKIVILTVLAKTFFSEPQAKKMRMPTTQVEQHLLAPAAAMPMPMPMPMPTSTSTPIPITAAAPAVTPIPFTTEVTYDSH